MTSKCLCWLKGGVGGQFPKNLNWCHKQMPPSPPGGGHTDKAIIRYLYLYKRLNKAKPQESEECYWFFNKCRKQHQSGYQINRDKVNHACIHNKHVWFFPFFHWRHLLSAGLAQAINQASCMTVLYVMQKLTANRRKFRLFNSSLSPLEKKLQKLRYIYYNNKQTNKPSTQQENLIPVS